MRFASERAVFKFYPETEAAVPAPSFKQVSNYFFLMGCHAGGTPIVNGVKKRTPLLGGVNTKKRGGTGVDVSIRHSTPLPPSLGLGRGKGEIHRGSNYFVFCFFCDNMLFFRVRKKEKKP
jgi:hypothetical protein